MMTRPRNQSAESLARQSQLLLALAAGILVACPGLPAQAAEAVLLTVAPRILTAADQDSFTIVVPTRTEGQVLTDRAGAEALRNQEKARLQETLDYVAGIKARIAAKKQENEAVEANIKLAKLEQRVADTAQLEAKLKLEKVNLELLEKRESVRQAEKGLSEAAEKAADALVRYFEVELSLITKRAEKPVLAQAANDDAALERRLRYERDVQELERKALEAIINQTDKREEALKKERDLLERRLELFEAQNSARKTRGK